MPGYEILEWSIQVDHIHLLMVIPPKYAMIEVIGKMKQYTASKMREKACVVREGILERAGPVVTGLFCFDGRIRRETDHRVCKMTGVAGFRSSEA
ncbi:MAG: transposase [Dehalococcoidia bacterium]